MEKSVIGVGYMRDKERRDFKARLVGVIASRIDYLVEKEGYTLTELGAYTGTPTSRLSEIKTGKVKTLSDTIILHLIKGGFMTVADIKEGLGRTLSENEEKWLADLAIHQSEDTLDIARMLLSQPKEKVALLKTKMQDEGLKFLQDE